MGRGTSKAGGASAASGTNKRAGRLDINNMTIEQARSLTKEQLGSLGLGEVNNFRTKYNADGTLAYATLETTEQVPLSKINPSRNDAEQQLRRYLKDRWGMSVNVSDIDLNDDNTLTLWTSSGKDWFRITSAEVDVENYIEPNTRFGKKLTDKISVRKTLGNFESYTFEFEGHKDF